MSSEVKNATVFQDVETIYSAAAAGDAEAVQFLMAETNWDPSITDHNGVLPLCYAAQGGNPEVIWLMVNGGADVNMADRTGKTPLDYARAAGNTEAEQYLLELGAVE